MSSNHNKDRRLPSDRERKVVDFLNHAAKKRQQSIPSQQIIGNNNIQAGGDISITHEHIEKKEIKIRKTVGDKPGSISPEQQYELKKWIDKLVDASLASGTERSRDSLYKTYWSKLNNKMKVTSYKDILSSRFTAALNYVKSLKAITVNQSRRKNKAYWRQQLYTGIYAHLRELGLPKEYAYSIVEDKMGKYVSSLKELSESELKKLYEIVFSMH